jgi:hypothetical protein
MSKRIEKIIKKAECIKNYLQKRNENAGNIDGLIKSLITYRDNIGDIPNNKRFYITMNNHAYNDRLNWETCIWETPFKLDNRTYISILDEVRAVTVECIDFTAHIRETLITNHGLGVFYSMPPEADNNIADAVFDVQTFKVDVFLSTELINAGLRPTKTNVRFVNDFE